MTNAPTGPLAGIKILDLGTMLAGPMAASIMADQGAEVIKVEPPGIGDVMRYIGANRAGVGSLFQAANRGKRSIALDIRTEAGRDVVHKLAREVDVVLHNFRPGVDTRLGIDYATLSTLNPDLVYLSVTGFGDTGPCAHKSAFDNVIQAFSGVAYSQADVETGEPVQYYQIFSDKLTAVTASQALTAALFARERGRGGQHVRLAMVDAVVSFMWPDVAGTAAFLEADAQEGMQVARGVPLLKFRNGYGQAAPVTDEQFAAWCRVFGVDPSDEKIATMAARQANPEALQALSAQLFANAETMDVDAAIAALEAADVPCARAYHLHELPTHPQMIANETFVEFDHPVAGRMREPRGAAVFDGTAAGVGVPAARLGEHGEAILQALGYDSSEITALRAAGVIGGAA